MRMPSIRCFWLLLAALVSNVAAATNSEDSAHSRGVSFLVTKVKDLVAPSTTTVVPEESDHKWDYLHAFSDSEPAEFLQAVANSGGSEADCKEFAKDTVSGIKTSVKSQQETLDGMDTGDNCAHEGQSFVASSQDNLDTAKDDVTAKEDEAAIALAAKTAACTAGVTLPLHTLNEFYEYKAEENFILAQSACASATTDSATADEAVSIAQAVVTAAETALKNAVAEAAKSKSECYCSVKNARAAAWALAASSALSNTADWKKAHEVICAVDQSAECVYHKCPTLEEPVLADGVADETCLPAETDQIDSVQPSGGSKGTVVRITGENLRAGGMKIVRVKLAGVTASIMSETDAEIMVQAGYGDPILSGTGPIEITSDTGSEVTTDKTWTYGPLAKCTSVIEFSGGGEGTVVRITGENLLAGGMKIVRVKLAGVDASITSATDVQIRVSAGFSKRGTGPIEITSDTGSHYTTDRKWAYIVRKS